jgi:hypothetical protein
MLESELKTENVLMDTNTCHIKTTTKRQPVTLVFKKNANEQQLKFEVITDTQVNLTNHSKIVTINTSGIDSTAVCQMVFFLQNLNQSGASYV